MPFRAIVSGGAGGDRILLDTLITPDPKQGSHIHLTRPLTAIGPGKQTLGLKLTDAQAAVLIETGAAVAVNNVVLGVRRGTGGGEAREGYAVRSIPGQGLTVILPDAKPRTFGIYDLSARLLFETTLSGATTYRLPARPESRLLQARIDEAGGSRWLPLRPGLDR